MEKLGVCTSRHVRTVSLVVTAVDDFTGQVITGSNARVWIDGMKPPIKKTDGWNVFINLPAGEYTVHAEGGFYNKSSFVCTVGGNTFPNIKIRLTPGRNAPISSDTACIEGRTAAGAIVLIRPNERALSYKLLSEAKQGEKRVGIYHPDGIDIEGKMFCIRSDRGYEEYVRIYRAEPGGKAEYSLSEALVHDYPKIGTLVFPVSESCADAKGEFYVPIKNIPDREVEFVCRRESGEGGDRFFKLTSGCRVKLEI